MTQGARSRRLFRKANEVATDDERCTVVHRYEPFYNLVDGELRAGAHKGAAINPATEARIALYHIADARLVDCAVRAAQAAFESWARTSLQSRRALLVRLRQRIQAQSEDLATLLTLEQGKPLAEAREEIAAAVALFAYYEGVRSERSDALFDEAFADHQRMYAPLGVVAGIVPWNFPFLIAVMKIAPALLTGNVIIIKPSPTTPLTTLAFARIAADAAPRGVLQVLGDDGGVGPLLTAHPGVRKVAFTGSTQTGRKVMAAGAETLKRLTLELGGNDAALVLADADIETTAAQIYSAAFSNAGQICGAAKRIYVANEILPAFSSALAVHVNAARVGDGLCDGVTIGPLQNRAQYQKAKRLMSKASACGAIIAQARAPLGKGFFVPPTLFTGLDETSDLVREEQFAPLAPILSFQGEDEVVSRANASPYGLTASVWSSNAERARAIATQLDAALVCVNKHNESPFELGVAMSKQSGVGWLLGEEGLLEFLQPRLVMA